MALHKFQLLFARSEFLSNVAKLTGGTVLAQLVTVLVSPLLSRVYSPSDFGAFAIYSNLVIMGLVVATGRYDLGIIIARKKGEALHLVAVAALFLLGFTALSGLAVVTLKGETNQLVDLRGYDYVLYLLPLSLFLAGVYQILGYWSNRSKAFDQIAFSKVSQNSLNSCVALALPWFTTSGVGLIIGNIVGLGVGLAVLLRKGGKVLFQSRGLINVRRLRHTLARHRDFPLYSLPTAFMDTLSLALPVFLLTNFYGGAVTGQYSLGLRILSMPLTLVGISIGQVFYQRLSETYNRKGDCWKLITRTWQSLFLIGLAPALLLVFFGPWMFTFVFGAEWEASGQMASIMAIPMFVSFCSSPTSTAFVVYRIQKLSFAFGLFSLVLRPLAFYLGYLQADVFLSLKILAVVDILGIVGYNFIIYKKTPRAVFQETA